MWGSNLSGFSEKLKKKKLQEEEADWTKFREFGLSDHKPAPKKDVKPEAVKSVRLLGVFDIIDILSFIVEQKLEQT